MVFNITDNPDLSLIRQQNINKAQTLIGSIDIASSYIQKTADLTSDIEYNIRLSINNALKNLFLFSATDEAAIVELAKNQYGESLLPPSVASGTVVFNADIIGVSIPQNTKFISGENIYFSTSPTESYKYVGNIVTAVANNNIVSLLLNAPCPCAVGTKINVVGLEPNDFNGNDLVITSVNGNSLTYAKNLANGSANIKSYNILSAEILNNVLTIQLNENFIFNEGTQVAISGLESEFNITSNVISVNDDIITLNITASDSTSLLNTGVLTLTTVKGLIDGIIAIIEVESDGVGDGQNISSGILVAIQDTINDLNISGSVDSGGITNGANQETPLEMQQRIINKSSLIVSYGNDDWFQNKMLDGEIHGVTRIKVAPNYPKLGIVTCLFVFDGRPSILPTQNEIEQMQTYLTTGSNANIFVLPDRINVSIPIIIPYNVNVSSLTPSNSANRDLVRAEIVKYFSSLDFTNGEIPSTGILSNRILSTKNVNGEFITNIGLTFTPLITPTSENIPVALYQLNVISGI